MSIATRIEAIEQHLTDDYSVLTLAGADLTNVDKNIVNLKPTWKERLLYFMNNGTDVVWDNWEKVVGEGTSLTLSNTEQAPMKVLLKGNTYQDSTTGKNLWGGFPNNVNRSNGSIDYVNNADGTISASGTATANSQSITATQARDNNHYITLEAGTYVLSGGISSVKTLDIRKIDNTQIGNDSGSGFRFTLEETTSVYIRANISSGTALSGTEVFKPMIEKNNTKTDYEPHTNGASPNPDYPQDIHVVSGDNEVIVRNGDNTQSKSYPINLPEGMFLGSIGDYKDRFFKAEEGNPIYDSLDSATKQTLDTNEWYLEKKIGKITFTGDEAWTKTGTQGYYNNSAVFNIFNPHNSTNIFGYCNKISRNNDTNYLNNNYIVHVNTDKGIEFRNTNDKWGFTGSDATAFKIWLATQNIILYYDMKTPTYTKIEGTLASQLEALNGSKSYTPQTNISQTNDDLPFNLSVTALKEV